MAKKILIVDDDLYIRDLYSEILQGEGYEVDTAVDGQDGLEKILLTHYDLVLLDLMMPRLDGIGLLRKIRENENKNLVGEIIIITNLANDPVLGEALALGVESCLIKSDVTPDELVRYVQRKISD
ncbi:MAG: response regulator [bacterium]|nr:response regulator [bacterium]